MTIIHMEPEQVRDLVRRLTQLNGDLSGEIIAMRRAKESLSMTWTGGSSTIFQEELQSWIALTNRQAIELETLIRRLSSEVEEWEQADASFGGSAGQVTTPGAGEGGIGGFDTRTGKFDSDPRINPPILSDSISNIPTPDKKIRVVNVFPISQLNRWPRSGKPTLPAIPADAWADLPKSENIPGFGELEGLIRVPTDTKLSKMRSVSGFSDSVFADLPIPENLWKGDPRPEWFPDGSRQGRFLETQKGKDLFKNINGVELRQIPEKFFSDTTSSVKQVDGKFIIQRTMYAGRGKNRSPIVSTYEIPYKTLAQLEGEIKPQYEQSDIPAAALIDLPISEYIPGFGDLEGLIRPPDVSNDNKPQTAPRVAAGATGQAVRQILTASTVPSTRK